MEEAAETTLEPALLLHSLPLLPHPSSLLHPGPFAAQEARDQLERLSSFAKALANGSAGESISLQLSGSEHGLGGG
jgi:hypothetical protein